MRDSLSNELIAKREIYKLIYFDGIDASIERTSWAAGPWTLDDMHCMHVIEDLFTIAIIYNVAVIYIGYPVVPTSVHILVSPFWLLIQCPTRMVRVPKFV